MELSERGLQQIGNLEGLRLKAYTLHEPDGFWTIGYGHHGADVSPDMEITQEQALAFLNSDCAGAVNDVNRELNARGWSVNQSQFDALVSYRFNRGNTGLKTLLANSTVDTAGNNMPKYWGTNVKYQSALIERRKIEGALYNSENPLEVEGGHCIGELVEYSSYYDSAYDTIDKAKFCTDGNKQGHITNVRTGAGVRQPYLIENGRCWVNDGDIRRVL
jgi:GH24 family phage-related lysozyme (muramidase)